MVGVLMLTPCIGCGVLIRVGTGGRCYRCKPRVTTAPRAIRASRAWRITAAAVRARGVCAMCGTRRGPFEADHIVPLSVDPTSTAARCLCVPCHKHVTRAQLR